MASHYCENISMLAVGQNTSGTVITRVRCKQWSCEYCAYINRVQWHMRIKRAILKNRHWSAFAFVTITAHEKMRTPKTSYRNLQNVVSKLLKRMRRANFYDEMPYVRVLEPHKDGALHAHLIIHWTLSEDATDAQNTRWLKDSARQCGGGYMADYQTITPDFDSERTEDSYTQAVLQVTAYVTKYMTKNVQETVKAEGYPRMRIIQASQDFPPELATDVEERDWRVQMSYRWKDYVQDVKPVRDVDIKMNLSAKHFDPRYDNRYPARLHFLAHHEQSKV